MGAPAADPSSNGRLFVNREVTVGRHIVNIDEVRPIIERHGFRIVDPGALSLDDQMALFSQARYVAGLHGAGLTNILYRRDAPLALLELIQAHPPVDAIHYQVIAAEMGYMYCRFATNPLRYTGRKAHWEGQTVDPGALDVALSTLTH